MTDQQIKRILRRNGIIRVTTTEQGIRLFGRTPEGLTERSWEYWHDIAARRASELGRPAEEEIRAHEEKQEQSYSLSDEGNEYFRWASLEVALDELNQRLQAGRLDLPMDILLEDEEEGGWKRIRDRLLEILKERGVRHFIPDQGRLRFMVDLDGKGKDRAMWPEDFWSEQALPSPFDHYESDYLDEWRKNWKTYELKWKTGQETIPPNFEAPEPIPTGAHPMGRTQQSITGNEKSSTSLNQAVQDPATETGSPQPSVPISAHVTPTNDKQRTRVAVEWCVDNYKNRKGPRKKPSKRGIAREAVDKFFPELSPEKRRKKIDSIRNTYTAKLP